MSFKKQAKQWPTQSDLVDARAVVRGVTAEGDFKLLQKGVHPAEQALRAVGSAFDPRSAVVYNHPVRKVCRHDEIVLDHERCLLGVEDVPFDDLRK